MAEKQYVIAAPNFSNGRDADVIAAITDPLKDIPGVILVGVEPEHDFNRTVVTLVGEPGPIKEALVAMAQRTVAQIDMREQSGSHPRIGAQDSLPISPLKNITIEETTALAEEIGQAFHAASGVPVFFAGLNARTPERESFAYIRKGQYEGLRQLLLDLEDDPTRAEEYNNRKPDLSTDGLLSDRAGATIVCCEATGLTAYNVFLGTENVEIAKTIAKAVRGPSGGFSSIRAVGIKFPEHAGVVVSMNLFDCINTPIPRVYEFCKREAERFGVSVIGSEIVGSIRLEAVLESFVYSLGLENFKAEQILETHLMD
ncbi:MAG: glutamate formimidoyltransferase [Oscillospiraceae bacterium]|nr:glutamate formimidoyltransferase [Oscillospiraceae bacterium]